MTSFKTLASSKLGKWRVGGGEGEQISLAVRGCGAETSKARRASRTFFLDHLW